MNSGVLRRTLLLAAAAAFAFPASAGAVAPGFNGMIAYVDHGDIVAVNPDGSGFRVITAAEISEQDPAWSPDGSRLAYSTYESLWTIKRDGSGKAQVPNTSTGNIRPTWSPDGTMIAYIGNGLALKVIGVGGTGGSQIHPGPWISVAWSPDGSKFAVGTEAVTTTPSSPAEIHVMNANGTGVTKLTTGQDPTWSPDGTKIAFARARTIYTMNPDGSGITPVVHSPREGQSPAWSPNGAKIAFSAGLEMGFVNPDGTGYAELDQFGPRDEKVDWQPLPVGLQASKRVVEYGKKAVVTVQLLSAATNKTVSLYKIPYRGSKTLVGSATVDSAGKRTFTVKPTLKTTYVAEWAGDASHGPSSSLTVDIRVRPVVTTTLRGHYGRAGAYRLYRLGNRIVIVGRVVPNHRGRKLRFVVQRSIGHNRWSPVATGSFTIGSTGRVVATFEPSRAGTYRCRNEIAVHPDHVAAKSQWQLAKVKN